MKRSILLAAIFAVICFVNAGAQYEPPDCLRLVCPDNYNATINEGCYNQDSVMLDTCMCPEFDMFDRGNHHLYAKGNVLIMFKYYCYPFANVLGEDEVGLTSNIIIPSVKSLFEEIENDYSDVYFTYGEFYNISDSLKIYNPGFILNFDTYRPVNQIIDKINEFMTNNDTIRYIALRSEFGCDLMSVEDVNINKIFISPNPTTDELQINLPNGNQDMIFIYSESGEKVKEMLYSEKINISDLPIGIYFIQIGNYRNKFIKK